MTLAVLLRDPTPPSWLDEYKGGHPELHTDTRHLIHKEPTDLPLPETQVSSLEQQPHPPHLNLSRLTPPTRRSGSGAGVSHRLGSSLRADAAVLLLLSHGDFAVPKTILLSRCLTPCICTKKRSSLGSSSFLVATHGGLTTHLCPQCRQAASRTAWCIPRESVCVVLLLAKKRQPKPRRSAAISDTSPHSTRARVTWQRSFHGATAVPSASCPACSHQPPPSSLIFCFSNNPSHLILTSHLVYTSLNQQQNLQAGPATTSLVTILHPVWAPLGGKLQKRAAFFKESLLPALP